MRYRIILPRALAAFWAGAGRAGIAVLWFGAAAGIVFLVFGFSFYVAMKSEMRSSEVRVPDLGGMTYETAAGEAESLDLVLQVVDQRHDPGTPSGRVLQQVPPAGVSVRRGRKIKLILSLGGQVLRVPDFVGQKARAVEIELRQEGFIPGYEARVHSTVEPAGSVLAQVPPVDTPTVPKTRVHRLVSDGPPRPAWVMPDMIGLTRQSAESWLSRAGFRVAVKPVSNADRRAGTVLDQRPMSGFPVRMNDIVELTVAR